MTRRQRTERWALKDQSQGSDWPPDVIWDVPYDSPNFPGVRGQNPSEHGYLVPDAMESLELGDLRIPGVRVADRLSHIEGVLRRAEIGAQLGKRDKALVDLLVEHFGDEEYRTTLEAGQEHWDTAARTAEENRAMEAGEKGPLPEGVDVSFRPEEFEPPPTEGAPVEPVASRAALTALAAPELVRPTQYEATHAGRQGIVPGSVGGRTDIGMRTEGGMEGRLFEHEVDAAARAEAASQTTLEGPPAAEGPPLGPTEFRREPGMMPRAGALPPREGPPLSGLPPWKETPRGRWYTEIRGNLERSQMPEPEKGRRLKGLGMQEAAERRRYEDRLTPKERAKEDLRAKLIKPSDTVTVLGHENLGPAEVISLPWGRVKVRYANGQEMVTSRMAIKED